MPTIPTRTRRIAPLATVPPDLAAVCLFSLLGLMLSAVNLSYVSSVTTRLWIGSQRRRRTHAIIQELRCSPWMAVNASPLPEFISAFFISCPA
jgi:hypothetical protein